MGEKCAQCGFPRNEHTGAHYETTGCGTFAVDGPRPASGDSARAAEWRCFHCDEVFTDAKAAALHFGCNESEAAACRQLNADENALLKTIADLAGRWSRCLGEDCDASRVYYSMSADMSRKVREAEQLGYDRGLKDGRALAGTPGLSAARDAVIEAAKEFVNDSYRPEPKYDARRFDKLAAKLDTLAALDRG